MDTIGSPNNEKSVSDPFFQFINEPDHIGGMFISFFYIYFKKTKGFIMFVRFVIAAVLAFLGACSDDSPKPTAPTTHTTPSYYCSLNGVTYTSEANYRSSCVTQTTPKSSSSIRYSSSNISSSSPSSNISSSMQTTPKEITQSVSCQGMNFKCSSVYAPSAKQACESLEQNLIANGMNLSGPGKKQAIQTMVQYECKCISDKEMKDYMTSVGCL